MVINSDDKQFLIEKIPQARELILNGRARDVLDAIDEWYLSNGFEPPDYYDYSAEGRKMQKVRDRIYEDNVLGK